MKPEFKEWLQHHQYKPHVILSRLSNCERVERYYGNLDLLYGTQRMTNLLSWLIYSTKDERRGQKNPSIIPIDGVLRTGLATLKQAVGLYIKFRESEILDPTKPGPRAPQQPIGSPEALSARPAQPTKLLFRASRDGRPDDERFVIALDKRMSEEGAKTELSDEVEGSLARRGFGVRRRGDDSALFYQLGSTSVIVFADRFKVFGDGGKLLGEGTSIADLDKHVIAEPGPTEAVRASLLSRIRALTSASIAAMSCWVSGFGWLKSKRSRSGGTRLTILGHELRLITDPDDFYGLTRGWPGNYIGETSSALLIWDPREQVLIEIPEEGNERHWRLETVPG